MIEPQDWVSTLRNLSNSELYEFLAAAKEAGRSQARQRREEARERGRAASAIRLSSPPRTRTNGPGSRLRSPSPAKGVAWGREPNPGSPHSTGSMALQGPGGHARQGYPEEWSQQSNDYARAEASPSRKGVAWGQPPKPGSYNAIGGMSLRQPGSPHGSPRRSISPSSQDQWAKPRSATAGMARMHRLASPTRSGGRRAGSTCGNGSSSSGRSSRGRGDSTDTASPFMSAVPTGACKQIHASLASRPF
jgi:hypothetical protein